MGAALPDETRVWEIVHYIQNIEWDNFIMLISFIFIFLEFVLQINDDIKNIKKFNLIFIIVFYVYILCFCY